MALRENMAYDVEQNVYTCQVGKKLRAKYESERKSKSGFVSRITHYECDDCSGCAYKKSCTSAKENRKIQVSKLFIQQRTDSLERHFAPHKPLDPVRGSLWCCETGLRVPAVSAAWEQESAD